MHKLQGGTMREELVTVCVEMRGDAGQMKYCVPSCGKNFEMPDFTTCQYEIDVPLSCHFVNSS